MRPRSFRDRTPAATVPVPTVAVAPAASEHAPQRTAPDDRCRRASSRSPRRSTTRATSTTPAASASSPTSMAATPARDGADGARGARRPGAPRRARRRRPHRRRRGHLDPDLAPLPRVASLREAGVRPPPRRRVAVGMCFLPPDAAGRRRRRSSRSGRWRPGLRVAGWRDGAGRPRRWSPGAASARRRTIRQAVRRAATDGWPARAFDRAPRARATIDRGAAALDRPGLEELAVASLSARPIVYKGLFVGDELGALLRRSARARPRRALRDLPPALQHQHLPVVAPGAAVPLPRAQRRDQHGPGEPRAHAGGGGLGWGASDGLDAWRIPGRS